MLVGQGLVWLVIKLDVKIGVWGCLEPEEWA